MANIFGLFTWRHLRAEPSQHILQYRGGRLRRSGRGLAFWFHPLATSIAEVPCSDRDETFLFHVRSSDFQDVMAQGTITYRVADPAELAARIDFSLDLASGAYQRTRWSRSASSWSRRRSSTPGRTSRPRRCARSSPTASTPSAAASTRGSQPTTA